MAGQGFSGVEVHGRRGGTPMLYLHGVPGAPCEAHLVDAAARENGVELWAINRAALDRSLAGEEYLLALADLVRSLGRGERLPVLGFSIGAALALRVASRLGSEAGPLFLMSAAGPLDAPGAFDGMGGGAQVFRLARKGGVAFDLLVRAQAVMARRASSLLTRLLFAGTEASDYAFASTPEGRRQLSGIYRTTFANDGAAYRRDLLAYVATWSSELAHVRAPVQIWHGRADNWAPIAMGRHIDSHLLPPTQLHEVQAGHYTTLINHAGAALTQVLPLSC